MSFDRIPVELRQLVQWLVWKLEERPGEAKPTKVPYRADRPTVKASTTDPATWTTFNQAVRTFEAGGFDGIGLVFSKDDGLCGFDLDGCFDEDGSLHPAAAGLVLCLDSYTEISQSGTGLHAIARASLNGSRHKTGETRWGGAFEVYDEGRYFAMTGDVLPGCPETVEERQARSELALEQVFPPEVERPAPAVIVSRPVSLTDRERLEKARESEAFRRLYDEGDTSAQNGDHSVADLALCGSLAFWTGDPASVDALFRRSALMRPKWDAKRGETTYGARTVARAFEGRTEFYDPDHRPASSMPSPEEASRNRQIKAPVSPGPRAPDAPPPPKPSSPSSYEDAVAKATVAVERKHGWPVEAPHDDLVTMALRPPMLPANGSGAPSDYGPSVYPSRSETDPGPLETQRPSDYGPSVSSSRFAPSRAAQVSAHPRAIERSTSTEERVRGTREEEALDEVQLEQLARFVLERADLRFEPGVAQELRVDGAAVKVRVWQEPGGGGHVVRVDSGWPVPPAPGALTLAELYFLAVTGKPPVRQSKKKQKRSPKGAFWTRRALLDSGVVERPVVTIPRLPESAPGSAVETWTLIQDLLSARKAGEPLSTPLALHVPFLLEWAGRWTKLTEKRLKLGKAWLEQSGYLTRVDGETAPGRFGNDTVLWRVATGRPSPLVERVPVTVEF